MKRMSKISLLAVCTVLFTAGCTNSNNIVGTWIENGTNEQITFDKNGSCETAGVYKCTWEKNNGNYTATINTMSHVLISVEKDVMTVSSVEIKGKSSTYNRKK